MLSCFVKVNNRRNYQCIHIKAIILLFAPDRKHFGHCVTGLFNCQIKAWLIVGSWPNEKLTAGQHSITLSAPTGIPQCINFKLGIQSHVSLGMRPRNRRLVWLSQVYHRFEQPRPNRGERDTCPSPSATLWRVGCPSPLQRYPAVAYHTSGFLTSFTENMEYRGIINGKANCK